MIIMELQNLIIGLYNYGVLSFRTTKQNKKKLNSAKISQHECLASVSTCPCTYSNVSADTLAPDGYSIVTVTS